ncbi:unnamed protein product, partial [Mesorhabditis spiculigera]
MANHGPSYGLSRELEKKNNARFSLEEAIEVLYWIEEATGMSFENDPAQFSTSQHVCDALKDGVMLAVLMNRLNGRDIVPCNMRPKMPFHKMENISNFLQAAKNYGVSEISLFQTVDLYENKQPYKVIECLRFLAAVAQAKGAPVPFPQWVVKLATNNPRRFDEGTMRSGDTVIPLQYGTNKCASQKGMTPYGLARQIKPDGMQ